jgi:hypothetical protein
MLLPILAFACAALGSRQDQDLHAAIILKDPATGKQTGYVEQRAEPLAAHPQYSPRMFGGVRWRFDWETIAFEKLIPGNSSLARFLVFSQERSSSGDVALSVTRMLERLWEYNFTNLHIDHSEALYNGLVYVYLCKGGDPGGEQLIEEDPINPEVHLKIQRDKGGEQRFDEDRINGRAPFKVDTIYLYDLQTFTDPVEMAREVAHEYGHASLTGVNGYSAPEDWANGFLGEKLFLRHMDEALAAKLIDPEDVMGVSQEKLDEWVAKNVNPLVARAASMGPSPAALKARDKQGMDDFIGLALYIDTILPESIFSRSLELIPSQNAEDYLDAILLAVEQPEAYKLRIPSSLVGKSMWVPLGRSVLKGAPILEHKMGWVKIMGQTGPVQILPGAG